MEPIQLTTREAIIYVALINAVIGFVLGLIPLGFGFFRGKKKMGILAIVCATVGGAILGIFLSIPSVAVFTWLIVRDSKKERASIPPTDDQE